jgi:hypothetical protein
MQLMNDPNYSFAGRFATSIAALPLSQRPIRRGFQCIQTFLAGGETQSRH